MRALLATLLLLCSPASPATPGSPAPAASATDFTGVWAGEIHHQGRTTPYAIELAPGGEGKVKVRLSLPVIHVLQQDMGEHALVVDGHRLTLGSGTVLTWDPAAQTLSGIVPSFLAPVYELPFVLRRVPAFTAPPRAELAAARAEPAWTHDAGAALWPGATYGGGLVYVGAEDGRVIALEARSGRLRWTFRTGGAVRARATVRADAVYVVSDDGFLYRLDARDGALRWRVQLQEGAVVRLPFDDPKSRFDRFGSAATLDGDRLYVGTNDGRLIALDAASGERRWSFTGAESVLAAPAVAGGRVYFGGYDGHVYALDATSGALLWKRQTGRPVVSTPAIAGDRVVVGSRSYDLFGLDAATGEVAWKHYLWFSWVESSPTLRDGVVYVGSSDAALVAAHEAASGRQLWATDVFGWAWGQPAVTATRVYLGTCGMGDYLAPHRGGVVAMDRATGRPLWRYAPERTDAKTYGFPGSPDVGEGHVYFTDLAGRVYAFAE
jgi:outer membrane protein assembly factor BamB